MSADNIVLVSGRFNVLHPGHLRLLRFAKTCGKRLIVAIESDRIAGKFALVREELRLEGVQSINCVDEAFIFDTDIFKIIENIKPDIMVKGKEFETVENPELKILEQHGARMLFSSGEIKFSSLELLQKEFITINTRSITLPKEYIERHNLSKKRLNKIINSYIDLKVCVVGDLIIDEYIACDPLGMSQEDATIVVTPVNSTRFIGGAGIVAAHAAGLGASVKFISVSGDDNASTFALDCLTRAGVESTLLVDDKRPTTLKQRYRTKGKSLLRVSYLHQGAISVKMQEEFLVQLEQDIIDTDLLVFSDFNYGCLPQSLVVRIIEKAKRKGILLAADSQSSSQIGDICRFVGMDLITPTEREARISTRNSEDGLVVLAEQLRQKSSAQNVLLKLGEEGLIIHTGDDEGDGWLTDRINALNSSAKDVTGAGDSLLITSAMTLASGGSIWEAACLGSLAAAVQVGRVGNTPLRTEDLVRELK